MMNRDRRKIQEDLHNSETRLRQILDSSSATRRGLYCRGHIHELTPRPFKRRAFSGWSNPLGTHSCGMPAARLAATDPTPAW